MKPVTLAAALVVVLRLLVGCVSSTVSESDARAVHQAVLDAHFEQDDWGQHGESLLILSDRLEVPEEDRGVPAQGDSRGVCLADHYPPSDAVADYDTKSERSRPLKAAFELPIEYQLLGVGRWRQILTEEGGWMGYEMTWPGARRFVQLSDVGFDQAGTTAIVYVADNPEAAMLYVLRNEDGKWQIVDGCMLWVS